MPGAGITGRSKPATSAGPATSPGPPATTGGSPVTEPAGWTAYYGGPSRSGVDTSSPPANNPRPAWTSAALDGAVYAQPLVVGSEVIVATEDDSVYALDAVSGAVRWRRHLASPVPGSSLPCGNIDPSGITGTPAVDPASGQIWVVTFSAPAVHTLWSLDLATGAVTSRRDADPPGADPRAQQQRGALALDGSKVYIPYGGLFGDCSDYHGWLVALSTSDRSAPAESTWETAAGRAGIWAPPGPVVNTAGDVFVATGNGTPVSETGDSDSVVRLSPSLSAVSVFTPANYAQLSAGDLDLGSTSPALLPGGLVFQIGKQGLGYLLPAGDPGGPPLATAQVCPGAIGGVDVDGDVLFVPCYDGLYAVRARAAAGSSPARLSVVWSDTGIRPGPPVVAGGDVWAVDTAGTLVGLAGTTGRRVYGHPIAVAGSFPSLAAAGGRLYVPDGDRIAAFGGI
ncbi:MAG: PQQ-binding-like beta-propeller repeat protein [Acidimicrobiales bacterium]